ncbi:hypothetical protein [Lysobacter silvisoli]|uniref:Uncharacterized protein n=1 Tax=Lysobacter silvisoli TaxID=2293254 RepID=A0A371K6M9_9GAMM|nr:hypothetical protein [Lysobacter silvisoli]RDZ29497.1 hypothetical protein DX914_10590 [Lysobacter silvisoli]
MKAKLMTVLAVALAVSACKPGTESADTAAAAPQALTFQALDVGKSVGTDQAVQPLTLFAPEDKLIASIKTQGVAKDQALAVKLVAMANGQSVSEANRSVSPSGATTTNLEFPKNGPWPLGRYVVEATLNGKPAGRQEIEVSGSLPAEAAPPAAAEPAPSAPGEQGK